MIFELLVAERLGAGLIHNLATPGILAPHTVSIIAGLQQVPLDARTANLQVTKGAINLFVIGLVEALAAYSAVVTHNTYLLVAAIFYVTWVGYDLLFFLCVSEWFAC